MTKLTKRQWAMVQRELALVEAIAARVVRRLPTSIDVEDMTSIGTLALISAAKRFDPRRGVPFGSYARFRVRGAMLSSLRGGNYEYELHESVSNDFLDEALFADSQRRGESGCELHPNVVPIDERAGPEEQTRSRETVGLIREAMGGLDERERFALLARIEGRTLREIGAHFGHRESWAHVLVGAALAKMRVALARHGLDAA